MNKALTILLLFVFLPFSIKSQNESRKDIVQYKVETFGSIAHKSTTPFWINSGSYGIVPLEANNVYLRGSIIGNYYFNQNLSLEAGVDLIERSKFDPSFFVQQLYASLSFKALKLSIGSKEDYHSMLDQELSSGDFSFSTNARPIPEINLSVPKFTYVPFTKKVLQFKGDFAVGKFMDNNYIKDTKRENVAYTQNILLHHKSLFLLLEDPTRRFPFYMILGFEDCAQWGGWSSRKDVGGDLPQSIKDFFKVVFFSSGDSNAPEGEQMNTLGNHLGTYNLKFGYKHSSFELAVYKQHFFEDLSGIEYANWKDGIWGLECKLFNQSFLKKILVEYIHTMDQSGPFHFPFGEVPSNIDARIGGGDNYYNHGLYTTGWSYFGNAIGSPLLTSPKYNEDNSLGFKNTRIKAWHLGLSGNLLSNFSYRILGTTMRGYGTLYYPFTKRSHTVSGLIECKYSYPKWKGWELGLQIAADKGTMYGNNIGGSLKITKTGNIWSN